MGVWSITTPAGSESPRQGDDRIRELKAALQEALQCNDLTLGDAASFPGNLPGSAPEFAYRGHRGTTAQRGALGEDVSGLCYDTDEQALYSYAGDSWNIIAHHGDAVIPEETVMVFYQAAAPVGWAEIDTPIEDYFLNVTTEAEADGGSEESTFNPVANESDHEHTYNHTHEHIHEHHLDAGGWAQFYLDAAADIAYFQQDTSVTAFGTNRRMLDFNADTNTSSSRTQGIELDGLTGAADDVDTDSQSANETTSGDAHTHDHVQADHAFANVILCDKDAY